MSGVHTEGAVVNRSIGNSKKKKKGNTFLWSVYRFPVLRYPWFPNMFAGCPRHADLKWTRDQSQLMFGRALCLWRMLVSGVQRQPQDHSGD